GHEWPARIAWTGAGRKIFLVPHAGGSYFRRLSPVTSPHASRRTTQTHPPTTSQTNHRTAMPHDLASRASVRGKSPSMPRPWRAAVLAASLILAACADDPVAPLAGDQDHDDVARSFAVHLTCTVDVERGSMGCDPSSPSG